MKLEGTIALQMQKANQLTQWGKQAQAYQAWNQEPRTCEMKLLAQGLSSPQIQERLATITHQLQQQTQPARGQHKGDRSTGLSL